MSVIPLQLSVACSTTPQRAKWLARLPDVLEEIVRKWPITLGAPFDDASCAWVAPVTRAGGATAVIKVGMPHMEAEHEADGLRFWDGDPTVRLLDADEDLGAMLLERCEPGTSLRALPETDQDVVIADLLRRLWRRPIPPYRFRALSEMTAHWSAETRLRSRTSRRAPARQARMPSQTGARASARQAPIDPGLVREGLRLFAALSKSAPDDVVLATDLHAGNVLRAERQAWLVIDPKPFVGDRAYDVTQHLRNCSSRMRAKPHDTIRRVADLAGVDYERVRLWMFARAAAEPRGRFEEDWLSELARELAP